MKEFVSMMAAVATVMALPIGMAAVWIPREIDRLEAKIISRIDSSDESTGVKISQIDLSVAELKEVRGAHDAKVLTIAAQMWLLSELRDQIKDPSTAQTSTTVTLAGFGNVDVPSPSVKFVFEGRTILGINTSAYDKLVSVEKRRLFDAAREGVIDVHVLDTDEGKALWSNGVMPLTITE